MSHFDHEPKLEDLFLTRREMLGRMGNGFATLGLMSVLGGNAFASQTKSSASSNPLLPRKPHFPGKAKRVIFLFMNGGPSQVDTFDPKPALIKYNGQVVPLNLPTERRTGAALASPYQFKKYGQSGIEVSEIFPNVAKHVDDMCIIRSMHADVPNHEPSLMLMNCGESRQIRPSMGSWVLYGLGTENQNLPGFVVLPDYRALPFSGSQQWGAGFLPASYQGTMMQWKGDPINDLQSAGSLTDKDRQDQMELLRSYNHAYLDGNFTNPDLQGRIDAYELAFRMQTEVPEALRLSKESEATRKMYGLDEETTRSFGTRCLMARQLVERGVRFVQLYTPSQSWDSHTDLLKGHAKNACEVDLPIAGLIRDLKQRNLLDSTLIVWMGEFGRTPDHPADLRDKAGRDHNTKAMTMFFAGGGVKPGVSVGATDELGWKAVEKVYRMRDVHATILHLMGLNDMRLSHYHAGRQMRLTDTGGEVINGVVA